MRPLVGEERLAIVDQLVAAFDAVVAGDGPRAISIEAPLGLGKTRLVQELFTRLSAERQGGAAYWPPSLEHGNARADDVLRARKQIEPTPGWVIPGGTEIPWLWWSISCQISNAGHPMRAMKDASDQLRVHLEPLQAKLQRAERSKDDALEVLSGVFDLVGVVNPGAALDAGSKFLGVFRRRRDEGRQLRAATMDRRIDAYGENYEEAGRIADSLSAVARAQTPVVLIVDDAQWADPALVSLLRHLITMDSAPVLLVTTALPDHLADRGRGPETFGGWLDATARDARGRLDRVALATLDGDALRDMIRGFAPRTEPAVVEGIATIASGNPLVLNLLLDLDVIRRDVAADGRIDTDPATLQRLPSTLRAIYQDLWEQLPAAERRVLALLAIQGPEFLSGFVEEAATRLGLHDDLMPAFVAVRDVRGWIRPVTDDRYEFAERQRFEIAEDVVHELFDAAAQSAIESAIIDHVLALKASDRWPELDLRTRRIALESHLDCNERLGEGVPRDLVAISDSMAQLADMDLDAGDIAKAAELDAGSRNLLEGAPEVVGATGPVGADVGIAAVETSAGIGWAQRPVPDLTTLAPSEVGALIAEVVAAEGSVEASGVYRLLTEASGSKRVGRRIRAALDSGVRSAVRRGTIIASAPDAKGSSDRRVLRPFGQADVGLPGAGAQSAAPVIEDEWGRHPWRGWVSHAVPTLPDLSPRQVADLIVEVVEAEGPVTVGRVTDVLRSASGAPRMSKSVSDAIESGLGSGQRRGDLVLVSGRRGEPTSRVLRTATQPEVVLRTVGDRDPSSMPPAEIAELARRVAAKEPALDGDGVKRRVGSILGAGRHTAALDKLLEAAIPNA